MIGSKDPSQSNKYKIETQSRIPISATYDGNVTGMSTISVNTGYMI